MGAIEKINKEFDKKVEETAKITDISPYLDDEYVDEYAEVNALIKKTCPIVRAYGAVQGISFLLSAWVANRMFEFSVWNNSTSSWERPFNDLCLVFTSIIIAYVCVSFFWKYLFANLVNVDDALFVRRLHRMIWLRLVYLGILIGFLAYIWKTVLEYEGGSGFAASTSIIFGVQIVLFVACEVLLQKMYKQISKF